jgi:hypothetical protein
VKSKRQLLKVEEWQVFVISYRWDFVLTRPKFREYPIKKPLLEFIKEFELAEHVSEGQQNQIVNGKDDDIINDFSPTGNLLGFKNPNQNWL